MPKRLNSFNGKRYESIVTFMHDVIEAGFDNEMDNARIMQNFSGKIDELWAKVERKGSYYITTKCRSHSEHSRELEVTFQSDIDESVSSKIILFVRPERDSLAIRRDVLEETIVIGKSDIAYAGKVLSYEDAKKFFIATDRFNIESLIAFEAMFNAISALSLEKTQVKISPIINGLHIVFISGNKNVSTVRFEYSK